MASAAMMSNINVLFVPPQIDDLDPEAFRPDMSTDDAISALGLDEVELVRDYVASMPRAIIETMMGAIHSALTDDPRSTVTVAWMEASRHGVKVSEALPDLDTGRGAVNIVLRGPLPETSL